MVRFMVQSMNNKKARTMWRVWILSVTLLCMGLFNWGPLPKASDDPTTIDEAIAIALQAHNDDPDAHLGTGQSLQSHRVNEIIDHLALSIVNDKIANGEINQSKLSATELQAYITFESLDGWTHWGGSATPQILGLALSTGSTINTEAFLVSEPLGVGDINSYDKDTYFQSAIKLNSNSNVRVYFMTGGYANDNTDSGFGFKIVDNVLSAIVVKSVSGTRTEYLTTISGITLTNLNIYKAYFDVVEGNIYFYVNGALVHTESAHLPTVSHPTLFTFYVKDTSASNRTLGICYLFYSRKI